MVVKNNKSASLSPDKTTPVSSGILTKTKQITTKGSPKSGKNSSTNGRTFELKTVSNSNFNGNFKDDDTSGEVSSNTETGYIVNVPVVSKTTKQSEDYADKRKTHESLVKKVEELKVRKRTPALKVLKKSKSSRVLNKVQINLPSTRQVKGKFVASESIEKLLTEKFVNKIGPTECDGSYDVNFARFMKYKSRNFNGITDSKITDVRERFTIVKNLVFKKYPSIGKKTFHVSIGSLVSNGKTATKKPLPNKKKSVKKVPISKTAKTTPKKNLPPKKKLVKKPQNSEMGVKKIKIQTTPLKSDMSVVLKNTKKIVKVDDIFVIDKKTDQKMTEVELLSHLNIKEIEFSAMPGEPEKINEASFSEVYAVKVPADDFLGFKPKETSLIVKICPFTDFYSTESFCKEILALKTLQSTDGCCGVEAYTILKGKYSNPYLKAWESYTRISENTNPASYSENQKYGAIFMRNCGVALETFEFHNVCEVFYFVKEICKIIVDLEKNFKFEHRDLHCSNILLKRNTDNKQNSVDFSTLQSLGKQIVFDKDYRPFDISIIDFSYSRIETDSILTYTDLFNQNNKWIFEGDASVDNQYQVYRDMAEDLKDWSVFKPYTNLLWVKHILYKLKAKTVNFNSETLKVFLNKLTVNVMVKDSTEELLEVMDEYFMDNVNKTV